MHVWLPEHLRGPEWGDQLDARSESPLSEQGRFEDADEARREAGVEYAVCVALVANQLGMNIPNEFVAEYVERNAGTTVGLASVDPNDPRAPDQLRDAIETLGLRGLKLSPPYQGFHPHSPEAYRVYDVAAELDLPVMWHQATTFPRLGVLEWAYPALLDKVMRDYPSLRHILAHGGHPWYWETAALMVKHPNVWTDISACFGRPWQLQSILVAAMEYGVADRVLFGTDFPLLTPTFCVERLQRLNEVNGHRLPDVPAELVDAILYERPLSLLGLEIPQR